MPASEFDGFFPADSDLQAVGVGRVHIGFETGARQDERQFPAVAFPAGGARLGFEAGPGLDFRTAVRIELQSDDFAARGILKWFVQRVPMSG